MYFHCTESGLRIVHKCHLHFLLVTNEKWAAGCAGGVTAIGMPETGGWGIFVYLGVPAADCLESNCPFGGQD